jgi:UDP-N-acetylglucosamine/UDP-N-acetyl-alpha-D-glucosaminouronate 4-epimerase
LAQYLVTGGGGFIGSHLVEELVRRGERVRVLDDFSTGRRENLTPLRDRIELIEGSVTDRAVVVAAVRGVDYVLHQAALPSVPRSIADPIRTHDVNVSGTLNLLVASREAKLRRFVFASSSSVYGDNADLPKREPMATRPLSPYAVSKQAGEAYALAFHRVYGLPVVALRYFNVFGPRQDPSSQYAGVIAKFITTLLDGGRPTIHGDGLQSRDFTYVSNVVQANLAACEHDEASGEVLNVARGESYSLLDLFAMLTELTGRRVQPLFAGARAGDVRHSLAAIEKATRMLGYRPDVSWREGLRLTVAWYRDSRRRASAVPLGVTAAAELGGP